MILLLAISLIAAGCGRTDAHTPQPTTSTQIAEMTEPTDSAEETAPPTTEGTEGFDLEGYMASVREQSDAIRTMLAEVEMTQLEMNDKARELYDLWDGALNVLWKELKQTLPEDEYAKLLEEQRAWIAEKEKAVEESGKEYVGGSLYQLIVDDTAAQITEERVNELYELLK